MSDSGKRVFYSDEKAAHTVPGMPNQELPAESKLKDPTPGVISPSPLEKSIQAGREQIVDYLKLAQLKYYETTQKYFETERQVTGTLSSLHDKKEQLLPNSLYVLAGFFTGSIFARRRNILARATFPIAFGLVSFRYFLPQTFKNTFGFIWELEKQNAPELANTQTDLVKKTETLISDADKFRADSSKSIQSYIDSSKKFLINTTGLDPEQEVSSKKK